MRKPNSKPADYFEIRRLADRVIRSFNEGYSTALRRVQLREKYQELKEKDYQVKLAGHLIVIEGGIKESDET